MNAAGGDVLLVIGDAAVGDGDALEQCLALFNFAGPKLFVPGNHELWTRNADTLTHLETDLPARLRAVGWRPLTESPFLADDIAIVGSVGWYDFSFAQPSLGIPRRFYEAKLSPGAAARLGGFQSLFEPSDDIGPVGRDVIARWNDGKFVRLPMNDGAFLARLLDRLDAQLAALANVPHVIAAIHHLPFAELLPPAHSPQWDFAKAYLGAAAIGELLLKYPNVKTALCGHSHFPASATVGPLQTVNIGAGYRQKRFLVCEVDETRTSVEIIYP